MLKSFLYIIICSLFFNTVKGANSDTLVVYLNQNGVKVKTKDSADYYRIILSPDTNIDRDLYRVYDYYLDGRPKMVATSLSGNEKLVIDGTCINFYKNGGRKSTTQFKNGHYSGSFTEYYPNGKIYAVIKIEDLNYISNHYNYGFNTNSNYKVKLLEMRDSTGNIIAKNGTGHIIYFDESSNKILLEGEIKNNDREGEWHGLIADSGKYTLLFHNDKLKSGISYLNSGHTYNFKKIETRAVFSDGEEAFTRFVRSNTKLPASKDKRKITGRVLVGFIIEINGTVSNVKVENGLTKSLNEEATRVIRLSPLWVPATLYGIPVKSKQTVWVDFNNL